MAMHMAMPQPTPWSLPDLFAAGAMWSIMMIAMMLPSATPMLLSFSATSGRRTRPQRPAHQALPLRRRFLLVWVAWS